MSDSFIIHVQQDEAFAIDEAALRLSAIQALIMAGAAAPAALTITLTDAERIQALNRQYAGIDATTDVLSFPAENEPYATEPGDPPYLGDIVIAFSVAEQQAHEAELPLLIELQTLAIHGTLHLIGYDHDSPDRQAEMWALQSAALDATRAGGAD